MNKYKIKRFVNAKKARKDAKINIVDALVKVSFVLINACAIAISNVKRIAEFNN